MNERNSQAADEVDARLRRAFASELVRAERDLASRPTPVLRRTSPGMGLGFPSLVTVAVIAIVAVVAARTLPIAGFSSSRSPDPNPTPPVTAYYSDGIPMAIDGEKVYRPSDVGVSTPGTPILVGGWDAGPVAVFCPGQVEGASAVPCPSYEGFAEKQGGPIVVKVMLEQSFSVAPSAFVVRAEVVALPTCHSDPGGGCPTRPNIDAMAVIWQLAPKG